MTLISRRLVFVTPSPSPFSLDWFGTAMQVLREYDAIVPLPKSADLATRQLLAEGRVFLAQIRHVDIIS